MGAFIISAIVAAVTILFSVLIIFASGMSDSPSTTMSPAPVFFGGMTIAGLILASHWLPHIGW